MTYASLQNRDGQYVQPDDTTFQAAAAVRTGRARPASARSSPTSPANELADYRRKLRPDARKAGEAAERGEVLKFFDWALKNGQKMAEELDYVALPPPLVAQIEDAWKAQIKDGAGKPLWN
jgi:phosphate transport system substrate-binding protein